MNSGREEFSNTITSLDIRILNKQRAIGTRGVVILEDMRPVRILEKERAICTHGVVILEGMGAKYADRDNTTTVRKSWGTGKASGLEAFRVLSRMSDSSFSATWYVETTSTTPSMLSRSVVHSKRKRALAAQHIAGAKTKHGDV